MLGYLAPGGGRTLIRVKPGLMFLLRLAWESRARLPLLIMSGFMALGVRIQMEINIDRAVRFMPRLRLEDEEFILSDDELDDDEDEEDEVFLFYDSFKRFLTSVLVFHSLPT